MTITSRTRVCGVVGHPVTHSLSPVMQNAAFRALKLDYVYLAFSVTPVDLRAAVEGMRALGIKGLNVTIPHKTTILAFLDKLTPEARALGAVNTVSNEDGVLVGHNTDGRGALRALVSKGARVESRSVLLLGAGGAARAIAHTLTPLVGNLTITNRTLSKARSLANALNRLHRDRVRTIPFSRAAVTQQARSSNIVLNATSIGLKAGSGELPLNFNAITRKHVMMDIVYGSRETPFIRKAKLRGALIVPGYEMLLQQGVLSFEVWTRRIAPVNVMRKALQNALKV